MFTEFEEFVYNTEIKKSPQAILGSDFSKSVRIFEKHQE